LGAKLLLLAVAGLGSVASGAGASADVVVAPFAGNWSTFGGTGTLHLPAVPDGGSIGSNCHSPAVYYGPGTYSVHSDQGVISGCTDSSGRHLTAFYHSIITGHAQHGTISIDVGPSDTTFSGTYHELADGTSGSYQGTFTGDFAGSGRTPTAICSMAHPHAADCIPIPSDAIRPAGAPEQGGPRTPSGPAVPPDERARGAVDWALAALRATGWTRFCEGFVESAYGTRGNFKSAAKLAASLTLQRGPAPYGALVFFRADWGNKYGHVGISLGGDRMISALFRVEITSIAKSPYWTHQYIGWSYAPPSWPGRAPTNP